MVGAGLPGKALGGVRVAVRIGDVGLDIVDGGAVHQVGPAHDEHRPHVRALLNSFQLYAGKPQRVRSEGRPVANTPTRVLPPRRGGRTVGDQLSRTAPENCHTSQI